ncbi:MAG: alpha/beta fold hydrolase [Saprospiraceae bacterium]
MNEEFIPLKIDTHRHIALWKMTGHSIDPRKQVLLTHGTFSNRKVLLGITDYLTKHGFTCWIFEWRNHGNSSRQTERFNFETIAKEDFKLVFNYLFEKCGIQKINCITHSGGGICLTMALVHELKYQERISSISLFGCQAFGAATSKMNYAKIYLAKQLSKVLGFVPARKVGGAENESYYFMKQWFNWNLTTEFRGTLGTNYRAKMKTIKVPILSICGSGDTFIAPPNACKKYLAAFENDNNEYLYCAKSTGYAEDYTHGRIIHSSTASREIYPAVLAWITKNKDAKIA